MNPQPAMNVFLEYGMAGAVIVLLIIAVVALWRHSTSLEAIVEHTKSAIEENTRSNQDVAVERKAATMALQELAQEIKRNTDTIQHGNVALLAAFTKALEK